MNQYSVADITRLADVHVDIIGNAEGKYFSNVRPISEADRNSLVWISPLRQDKQDLAHQTRAEIVICDKSLSIGADLRELKCFVVTERPKLLFLRVVEALFSDKSRKGIHDTAWVHPEAKISPEAYIGPFTYVGRAEVGEKTVLHGHCHIYDKVKIGRNVTINAGTVIGSDGFGYERNEEGQLERFPHIGGVIIEDNVDIGANACIDRGTLGDTIIKEGAKIDNQVHIAHNIVVGRDAAVIAHAMVGGSVRIGDRAWLAPSASVMDRISIGADSIIGLGAVVLKDVPDKTVVVGNPARELKKKS